MAENALVPTTATTLPPPPMLEEVSRPQAKIEKLTKWLMKLILNVTGTKVIFVTGLMGSGKSSLIECITGCSGYSGSSLDSVTKKYALTFSNIGGQFYVFVDTPGFGDPNTSDTDVFYNIMECVNKMKNTVNFCGILYVTKLDERARDDQKRFVEWLSAFSGQKYFKNITFVSTHWDGQFGHNKAQRENLLVQWQDRWEDFLDKGAKLYEHGKDVKDFIENADEMKRQARNMIAQNYGTSAENPKLGIVSELEIGIPLHETAAAKLLLSQSEIPLVKDKACLNSDTEERKGPEKPRWGSLFVGAVKSFFGAVWNYSLTVLSVVTEISSATFSKDGKELVVDMPLGLRVRFDFTSSPPRVYFSSWFSFFSHKYGSSASQNPPNSNEPSNAGMHTSGASNASDAFSPNGTSFDQFMDPNFQLNNSEAESLRQKLCAAQAAGFEDEDADVPETRTYLKLGRT